MKKKLLLDCRFWGPSHTGLGRYTESLAKSLHQQNLKGIEFYCLINPHQKRFLSQSLPRFKTISVKSRPYSLMEQIEVPRLIKKLNPDLTHFLHFNVPLLTPKPFMVTIHDLIKHHSRGLKTTTRTVLTYPVKRLGYHLTIRQAVIRAERIITPRTWVKQDILKYYQADSKKIKVVAEAAANVYFKASDSDRKLAPKYPYLVYVGNAYPHKNILQLIKAVKKYNVDKNMNLRLIIVTAKDFFYQKLRREIRQLQAQSVVKIKGFSSDKELRAYYRYSLAFITASLFEGFGLPGLEAMASGTVTLASERTSLPEVYGKAAKYFNPDDLNQIVKAIDYAVKLSYNQRQKLVSSSKKHVAGFSWEKAAKETGKLYETSLGL